MMYNLSLEQGLIWILFTKLVAKTLDLQQKCNLPIEFHNVGISKS